MVTQKAFRHCITLLFAVSVSLTYGQDEGVKQQVLQDVGAQILSEEEIQAEVASRIGGHQELSEKLKSLKEDESLIILAVRLPFQGTSGRHSLLRFSIGEGGPVAQQGEMMAQFYQVGTEIPYLGTLKTRSGDFEQVYFFVRKAASLRLLGLSEINRIGSSGKEIVIAGKGLGFIIVTQPKKICFVNTFAFNFGDKSSVSWETDPELNTWIQKRFADVSSMFSTIAIFGPAQIKSDKELKNKKSKRE